LTILFPRIVIHKSNEVEMGKSRYVTFKDGQIGLEWVEPPFPPLPDGEKYRTILGKQEQIYSHGNPISQLGKSAFIGGNFFLVKNELAVDSHADISYAHGGGFRHYSGSIYATKSIGVGDWPIPSVTSDSELNAFGTTAIANVEPTNPVSNLLGTLGEIKADGLPSVVGVPTWRDRTQIAKAAGSEYLNVQFGWKPLIGDIRNFAHAVTNSDELIRQYERNSGRKIKRSMSLPAETTVQEERLEGADVPYFPTLGPAFGIGGQKSIVTTRHVKKRWFEGCFTYYLPSFDPNGDNFTRNRLIAEKLFGARVTPELVWDLTPWTWALDWMGNFGDVLHNVGAFANTGLVMQYGYVMEQQSIEVERTVYDLEINDHPGQKFSFTTTLRTIAKRRHTATPYGFGLDVGSFTPQQTAILVALGFSRG
jgi:hypothetical protein